MINSIVDTFCRLFNPPDVQNNENELFKGVEKPTITLAKMIAADLLTEDTFRYLSETSTSFSIKKGYTVKWNICPPPDIEPTRSQIKEACRIVNKDSYCSYRPSDYKNVYRLQHIAKEIAQNLATRSLAWEQDIAERDARIAELEAAMGVIACNACVRDTDSMAQIEGRLMAVLALAAKHAPKPKPDVLEEALSALRIYPDASWKDKATVLRAELAKRGVTIPGGEG